MPLHGPFTKTRVTWQFLAPCKHQGAPPAKACAVNMGARPQFPRVTRSLQPGGALARARSLGLTSWATGCVRGGGRALALGGQQNSLQTLGTARAQGAATRRPGTQPLIHSCSRHALGARSRVPGPATGGVGRGTPAVEGGEPHRAGPARAGRSVMEGAQGPREG